MGPAQDDIRAPGKGPRRAAVEQSRPRGIVGVERLVHDARPADEAARLAAGEEAERRARKRGPQKAHRRQRHEEIAQAAETDEEGGGHPSRFPRSDRIIDECPQTGRLFLTAEKGKMMIL
jgi:hypothetical protein